MKERKRGPQNQQASRQQQILLFFFDVFLVFCIYSASLCMPTTVCHVVRWQPLILGWAPGEIYCRCFDPSMVHCKENMVHCCNNKNFIDIWN